MPTSATPQDDPNVKIPSAIKATAARAAEIHRQAYSKEAPPEDPKKPDPAATTEPPKEAAPPVEVEAVTQKGNEPPKEVNWEHAFKSMQGRYNGATKTIKDMGEQITNLQAVIANMQSHPAPVASPTPRELAPEALLTQKEIEEYGADFLNVVGKKAKEIAGGEISELKNQVADLTRQLRGVGQTVSITAQDRMKKVLSDEIPNWEQVNLDDDFLAWLKLPDPFSGAIRHELLKQAWQRNETPRVLAFFRGFLAREAPVVPASNQPDPPQGEKPGKIPLEAFAAPGRAKTAADTGSPAEKPFITRAQITDFYRDLAAGRYRGRDKEKDAFEREIFSAEREGRIR